MLDDVYSLPKNKNIFKNVHNMDPNESGSAVRRRPDRVHKYRANKCGYAFILFLMCTCFGQLNFPKLFQRTNYMIHTNELRPFGQTQ